MKTFKQFLYESLIDPVRKTFPQEIFDNYKTDNPKFKKSVIDQIKSGAKPLENIAPISSYDVLGSILTKQHSSTADVDVNVTMDLSNYPKSSHEDIIQKLRKTVSKINGQKVKGSDYEINYFVVSDELTRKSAIKNADAVYSLDNNSFIKKPKDLSSLDIDSTIKSVHDKIQSIDIKKGELFRDVIDYETLKGYSKSELEGLMKRITSAIKNIEGEMKDLIEIKDDITNERRKVFARDLTSDEIKKYATHNALPENILYKLLEKYHYLSFIKKIKDILGPDKKLSAKEADKMIDLVKSS